MPNTEQALREALGKLIAACDAGTRVERGAGGMSIDAQIRRTVINGVSAWAVEEARDVFLGISDAALDTTDTATLIAQRDAALRECSKWAREAGEAKGRLEASEMAGIVEGWKERAERAEALLRDADMVRVPREPTPAMIDRFVSRALCVSVHGDGGWSNYAREQWKAMIAAAQGEE